MYEGHRDGPKGGGGIEGGRWVWVGWGKVVVGKWRQLYSNTNLKNAGKNTYMPMLVSIMFMISNDNLKGHRINYQSLKQE